MLYRLYKRLRLRRAVMGEEEAGRRRGVAGRAVRGRELCRERCWGSGWGGRGAEGRLGLNEMVRGGEGRRRVRERMGKGVMGWEGHGGEMRAGKGRGCGERGGGMQGGSIMSGEGIRHRWINRCENGWV